MTKYRTIVADPPWDHSDGYGIREGWYFTGGVGQRSLPYAVMPLVGIKELPVGALAGPECRVFLWTTNRYLRAAFDVLDAWGFSYRQTLVWHKTNASPFSGSVAHGSAEFILVGTKGSPAVIRKMPSSVLAFGHQHSHSQKPEMFIDWFEQVSPGPYLELFARRQRLGWDTWGNEALNHVALDTGAEGPLALERTE